MGTISFLPAQTSLAVTTAVPVSDTGSVNSLAYSDTTRKVAISPDGDIYVAYHGQNGLWVSRSTNRGLSFLQGVKVASGNLEAEIAIADNGYIYLVYPGSQGYYLLSRSFDKGAHFYPIAVVGQVRCGTAHLAADGPYLYVQDRCGTELYRNNAYGVGLFNSARLSTTGTTFSDVQFDPTTHQVFVGGGATNFRLISSKDAGQTFGPLLNLGPVSFANLTTALSAGANGSYLFLSGGQSNGSNGDQAFRVNLNNPELTPLAFGWNTNSRGRSLDADQYGNVIDAYYNSSSAVSFRVSHDLGQSFEAPILVSQDASAINVAINDISGDIIAVYESHGRIWANIYPDMLTIPDLAVTLTSDNPRPNYAQAASFNVKVSNSGRVDATTVQVKVEIPDGLKLVSQAASQGNFEPGTGLWTISNLARGKPATLTVLTWITKSNFKQAITAKLVSSTPEDQSKNNNSPVLNYNIPTSADIGLDLNTKPTSPGLGDTIQITLNAVNHGPDIADSVKVGVTLPDGLEYLSHSTGNGTYTPENRQWSMVLLGKDQPASLVLTARVKAPGPFDITAKLVAQDQYDSNNGNDSAATHLNVSTTADIAIQNTVDNPRPLYGQTINFTVQANNLGPGQASNVKVLDRLPDGLLYRASTPSQGTYNPVSGVWNVGAIGVGQSASLKVTAEVRAAGVTLINEASVAALDQPDSNPANNVQALKLVIPTSFDLELSASVDNLYPQIGQNIQLNLALRNQGPGPSPNVNVVYTRLPAGLSYLSFTASKGTFDPVTGQWAFGSLAKDEEASLQIKGLVNQGGAQTSTFSLAAQDLNQANNSANLTLYAQNWVPLDGVSAQLRVTPDREFSLAAGNLLTYRVLVKNLAPEVRQNVIVRFPIDPNLELANVTFSNPLAWVSKVVTDQPNPYVEMRLPDLQMRQMVTASVRFRAGPGAQPGAAILSRFTVQVNEPEGDSYTTFSNGVRFILTTGSNRDDSGGGVQFYNPLGASTGTAATLKLAGDFYTPGEKVNLWYTHEKGLSIALGDIYANREGQAITDLSLKDLKAGQSYVVAGYGNQSEIIGCAVVTVTGQGGPDVKSYTVRPLNSQEIVKQLKKN